MKKGVLCHEPQPLTKQGRTERCSYEIDAEVIGVLYLISARSIHTLASTSSLTSRNNPTRLFWYLPCLKNGHSNKMRVSNMLDTLSYILIYCLCCL